MAHTDVWRSDSPKCSSRRGAAAAAAAGGHKGVDVLLREPGEVLAGSKGARMELKLCKCTYWQQSHGRSVGMIVLTSCTLTAAAGGGGGTAYGAADIVGVGHACVECPSGADYEQLQAIDREPKVSLSRSCNAHLSAAGCTPQLREECTTSRLVI